MQILGITHPVSWNSAACLIVDGTLVAFAEEERFIRLKHAPHIHPSSAIAFCLKRAGIGTEDIDVTAIGFEHPNAKHARQAQAKRYLEGSLPDKDWFRFSTSLSLIHGDTQMMQNLRHKPDYRGPSFVLSFAYRPSEM